MTRVRHPAVAGTFYPADPHALATMVDRFVAAAPAAQDDTAPVAVIAPHAGYAYSGPTAGRAYARVKAWASAYDRVVVVGPAHRVPVHGLGLSTAEAFDTPLGRIRVDREACDELATHAGVTWSDDTHRYEHSVEVHLPFLQRVLGHEWVLVPVVAGNVRATTVADAFEQLWAAPRTLFVVSTDLSHYHHVDAARRLDRATAATIVAASWERLDDLDACGAVPVRGALELARRRGEHVELVQLSTSADTIGPDDRVVGYGSFVIR